MAEIEPVVRAVGLTKVFRDFWGRPKARAVNDIDFEIRPGDACLVIFADIDIDSWFATGEVAEPRSGRKHSLSDGFAFVGFRTARG